MTSLFEIDELQLYFGDPYIINDKIKIMQPTLGDIMEFGEAGYFSMIHSISAIPSDMKAALWDQMGIDWNEIEDFELFMILIQNLTPDKTYLLFGDLDFSKLKPYRSKESDEIVLADKETGLIIDKLVYLRIVNYVRKLHNIKPKVEKAANKITKKVLLDEDRTKILNSKDKPFKSYLLPMISAVKVKQGYSKDYVRNMGLMEFFTEISRLQIIDQADHLLNGAYSGFADLSKVPKKNFDWMRPINDD